MKKIQHDLIGDVTFERKNNLCRKDLDERLSVFRFEQIIGYIETAIGKSKLLLKEKL